MTVGLTQLALHEHHLEILLDIGSPVEVFHGSVPSGVGGQAVGGEGPLLALLTLATVAQFRRSDGVPHREIVIDDGIAGAAQLSLSGRTLPERTVTDCVVLRNSRVIRVAVWRVRLKREIPEPEEVRDA